MSPEEVKKKMHACGKRRQREEQRIVDYSRTLVATLKDRGCTAAAGELSEMLFQLDAIDGELNEVVRENPEAAMNVVLGLFGGTQ